jgi:hypothetical protein
MLFFLDYLLLSQKSVPLQCVFHSIRFKVNKGWSKALLLFLCLYVWNPKKEWYFCKQKINETQIALYLRE